MKTYTVELILTKKVKVRAENMYDLDEIAKDLATIHRMEVKDYYPYEPEPNTHVNDAHKKILNSISKMYK